jgi:hypothetical protein
VLPKRVGKTMKENKINPHHMMQHSSGVLLYVAYTICIYGIGVGAKK